MANSTIVNPQITDSVDQVNIYNLGIAPIFSLDQLYVGISTALVNAAHNATSSQQHMNMLAQAVTAMGATTIYANVKSVSPIS